MLACRFGLFCKAAPPISWRRGTETVALPNGNECTKKQQNNNSWLNVVSVVNVFRHSKTPQYPTRHHASHRPIVRSAEKQWYHPRRQKIQTNRFLDYLEYSIHHVTSHHRRTALHALVCLQRSHICFADADCSLCPSSVLISCVLVISGSALRYRPSNGNNYYIEYFLHLNNNICILEFLIVIVLVERQLSSFVRALTHTCVFLYCRRVPPSCPLIRILLFPWTVSTTVSHSRQRTTPPLLLLNDVIERCRRVACASSPSNVDSVVSSENGDHVSAAASSIAPSSMDETVPVDVPDVKIAGPSSSR